MPCTFINKSSKDTSGLETIANDFFPYAEEKMGFDQPVEVIFLSDEDNAANPLGKTAFYDPLQMAISLFVDGRHPKDILRSFSHELVHHAQNCRGEFSQREDCKTNFAEEGYAQNDVHLREMEREAYETGNLTFRDWEDSRKQQLSETLFNSIVETELLSEQSFKDLARWTAQGAGAMAGRVGRFQRRLRMGKEGEAEFEKRRNQRIAAEKEGERTYQNMFTAGGTAGGQESMEPEEFMEKSKEVWTPTADENQEEDAQQPQPVSTANYAREVVKFATAPNSLSDRFWAETISRIHKKYGSTDGRRAYYTMLYNDDLSDAKKQNIAILVVAQRGKLGDPEPEQLSLGLPGTTPSEPAEPEEDTGQLGLFNQPEPEEAADPSPDPRGRPGDDEGDEEEEEEEEEDLFDLTYMESKESTLSLLEEIRIRSLIGKAIDNYIYKDLIEELQPTFEEATALSGAQSLRFKELAKIVPLSEQQMDDYDTGLWEVPDDRVAVSQASALDPVEINLGVGPDSTDRDYKVHFPEVFGHEAPEGPIMPWEKDQIEAYFREPRGMTEEPATDAGELYHRGLAHPDIYDQIDRDDPRHQQVFDWETRKPSKWEMIDYFAGGQLPGGYNPQEVERMSGERWYTGMSGVNQMRPASEEEEREQKLPDVTRWNPAAYVDLLNPLAYAMNWSRRPGQNRDMIRPRGEASRTLMREGKVYQKPVRTYAQALNEQRIEDYDSVDSGMQDTGWEGESAPIVNPPLDDQVVVVPAEVTDRIESESTNFRGGAGSTQDAYRELYPYLISDEVPHPSEMSTKGLNAPEYLDLLGRSVGSAEGDIYDQQAEWENLDPGMYSMADYYFGGALPGGFSPDEVAEHAGTDFASPHGRTKFPIGSKMHLLMNDPRYGTDQRYTTGVELLRTDPDARMMLDLDRDPFDSSSPGFWKKTDRIIGNALGVDPSTLWSGLKAVLGGDDDAAAPGQQRMRSRGNVADATFRDRSTATPKPAPKPLGQLPGRSGAELRPGRATALQREHSENKKTLTKERVNEIKQLIIEVLDE